MSTRFDGIIGLSYRAYCQGTFKNNGGAFLHRGTLSFANVDYAIF